MKSKLLPSIFVTVAAINMIVVGFLAHGFISRVNAAKYIVAAGSAAKPLQEAEKTSLALLAEEIWHQKGTQTFRCTYSQNPTCTTVLEGKPFQVNLSQDTAQKLLDQTKSLWGTEGFIALSHIDCALGDDAKCQVFGSIEKSASELEPGQCIAALKKG